MTLELIGGVYDEKQVILCTIFSAFTYFAQGAIKSEQTLLGPYIQCTKLPQIVLLMQHRRRCTKCLNTRLRTERERESETRTEGTVGAPAQCPVRPCVTRPACNFASYDKRKVFATRYATQSVAEYRSVTPTPTGMAATSVSCRHRLANSSQ